MDGTPDTKFYAHVPSVLPFLHVCLCLMPIRKTGAVDRATALLNQLNLYFSLITEAQARDVEQVISSFFIPWSLDILLTRTYPEHGEPANTLLHPVSNLLYVALEPETICSR